MALSTISTVSSHLLNGTQGDQSWGPVSFIFPTALTGMTISNNTVNYTTGTGSNTFKNGTYVMNANCWKDANPPYFMFDNNTTTFYFGGVNAGTNYKLDGSTSTYNRNAYTINTAPAPYVGGNSAGTATFNTNGYAGEYYQIQYPFMYILTKIYIQGQAGIYYTRSPKKLYIFGSNDGTTWTYITLVTTAITNSTSEFSYSVTNTTQYNYYRFVANTLIGGNSWDGALAIASFRTEGMAYELVA
jgi:hypothetical protein